MIYSPAEMSLERASDIEKSDDQSRCDSDFKCQLDSDLKEKLRDIPGALEYIQKLEKLIGKHVKKIVKLKNKLRKKEKVKDAFTQTEFEDAETLYSSNDIGNSCDNESRSLAEDIKDAAEMAMKNTGFVYEETSGMYYDYNTGYYYNAEYGLYYDGSTGTYLKYNQDSQSYEFHSQVSVQEAQTTEQNSTTKKNKRKNKYRSGNKDTKRHQLEKNIDLQANKDFEEGECSSDSGESSSEDGANSDISEISKHWPPCMRLIVEATDSTKLKVGSLHIITFEGGTIGREGNHSILLPDINASKHHLKLTFDKETSHFYVVDLGSRNGTLLNGKRMSPSKQESDPMKVTHGSKLQISSTVFLCHIHDGNQTCGHCEPGLLQPKEKEKEKVSKTSRSERHKKELKNLRMMCGVNEYDDDVKLASGYTDRAQKRRETVGSQNPHEKTKVASIDECIDKENKGFKLLSKMGWKEGQSLGKDGEGLLEPVKLISNQGTAGIGCSDVVEVVAPNEKKNVWRKAQQRFEQLPESSDAFLTDSAD